MTSFARFIVHARGKMVKAERIKQLELLFSLISPVADLAAGRIKNSRKARVDMDKAFDQKIFTAIHLEVLRMQFSQAFDAYKDARSFFSDYDDKAKGRGFNNLATSKERYENKIIKICRYPLSTIESWLKEWKKLELFASDAQKEYVQEFREFNFPYFSKEFSKYLPVIDQFFGLHGSSFTVWAGQGGRHAALVERFSKDFDQLESRIISSDQLYMKNLRDKHKEVVNPDSEYPLYEDNWLAGLYYVVLDLRDHHEKNSKSTQ